MNHLKQVMNIRTELEKYSLEVSIIYDKGNYIIFVVSMLRENNNYCSEIYSSKNMSLTEYMLYHIKSFIAENNKQRIEIYTRYHDNPKYASLIRIRAENGNVVHIKFTESPYYKEIIEISKALKEGKDLIVETQDGYIEIPATR